MYMYSSPHVYVCIFVGVKLPTKTNYVIVELWIQIVFAEYTSCFFLLIYNGSVNLLVTLENAWDIALWNRQRALFSYCIGR